MQALIHEVRDETLKQMAKTQEEPVVEITTSHERTLETLWNIWRARNANIIKVICRDEVELHMVREAALGPDMSGQ
jgi:hypothetical protein